MRSITLRALAAIALLGSGTACKDYLTGPGLQSDPNRPTSPTAPQLFTGIQTAAFMFQEGQVAWTTSMWLQQLSGITNQSLAFSEYGVNETTMMYQFDGLYLGGGLIDMRAARMLFGSNERVFRGITGVWQGFTFGMAASLWGDLPYSEATADSIAHPKLDKQEDVYASVQAALDSSIADLKSGVGTVPGSIDLVYNGRPAPWIEAANTLKARFYMHWVEAEKQGLSQATVACGGHCLQKAIDAAKAGISSPANDMRTFHNASQNQQNVWYQFMDVQRNGYMGAGRFMVELMKQRSDPRLADYFSPVVGGTYAGRNPGEASSAPFSSVSDVRLSPTYRQPLVTYAENQFILAEAYYYQANEPEARIHASAASPSPITSSGRALLVDIMDEKYIALFQNMEVFNDYKRTCLPAITPYPGNGGKVPGRLLYSLNERNGNPNIPLPASQPVRNTNDPNGC